MRYFGGSRYNKLSSPKDPRMGHASLITDLQFGPDGRRLFTSSFDGTIRVWDVPTGLCVDWSELSKLIYFILIRRNVGANSFSPM